MMVSSYCLNHNYNLFLSVFGVSVAFLLLSLVYLPAEPPTPPSITATSDRYDFKHGFFTLIR